MLSDKDVRGFEPPATGNAIHYDGGGGPGFGLRITANDVRAFVLSYRATGIAWRTRSDAIPSGVSRRRGNGRQY